MHFKICINMPIVYINMSIRTLCTSINLQTDATENLQNFPRRSPRKPHLLYTGQAQQAFLLAAHGQSSLSPSAQAAAPLSTQGQDALSLEVHPGSAAVLWFG